MVKGTYCAVIKYIIYCANALTAVIVANIFTHKPHDPYYCTLEYIELLSGIEAIKSTLGTYLIVILLFFY